MCPYSHKFFSDRDKRMMKVDPSFAAYWATLTGAPPPKPKPQGGGWDLDEQLQ
jgi:hypothetical protein